MLRKPLKEKTETDTWNIMTEESAECEVCGKPFRDTYGAFGRCPQCRREKRTRCDVCGKIFKSAHGASGICPECRVEFEPTEMEYVDMDGNIHQRTFPRL